MSFRPLFVCLAVALLGVVSPAQAQWSNAQRSGFMRDCVPGCQNNPNVHPTRRAECPAFCQCFVDEAERLFPDYAGLEREIGGAIETENVQRFKAIGPVCNRRVFGE
jgi:hypothetical protein